MYFFALKLFWESKSYFPEWENPETSEMFATFTFNLKSAKHVLIIDIAVSVVYSPKKKKKKKIHDA